MKHITKKEAKARRVNWDLALREGRVIRTLDGLTFKSFPTIAARDEYLAKVEAGLFEIVKVS